MREVKFRMFIESRDGRNKFMTNSLYHTGRIINLNDFNKEFAKNGEFVGPKKVTYLQYTGLKDVNDVEIFEGDVVQIKDHAFQRDKDGIGIDIDGNYVVKWSENMELILSTSIDDDGGWLLNKNLCYVTVIGNIYENPELLEGKR